MPPTGGPRLLRDVQLQTQILPPLCLPQGLGSQISVAPSHESRFGLLHCNLCTRDTRLPSRKLLILRVLLSLPADSFLSLTFAYSGSSLKHFPQQNTAPPQLALLLKMNSAARCGMQKQLQAPLKTVLSFSLRTKLCKEASDGDHRT